MSVSTLELITKAACADKSIQPQSSDSQYPIVLNPDPIFPNLKSSQPTHASFIQPVQGWEISQSDTQIIELAQNFYIKLKIKPKSFNKDEFINMLNSYLEKNADAVGISIPKDEDYTKLLLQKVGILMGDVVLGLVLDACLGFEIWDILENLIVAGLVHGSCCKDLVFNLIEKNRADLVCLCVKCVSDLQVSDVLSVFKFFLSPPKGAYDTMMAVRKDWERQTVSAIDMATDKSVGEKKLSLAKDAAVLLMMAHDEFTTSELCLHSLIASSVIDDVILSACIGKLNGSEIMCFVRYLNKWLGKYHKFPQACSIPTASSTHGLNAFESVPSLEHVIKCFGLVIDEHFSSLVMHPEFCQEVKSVELVVHSLASEARLCCTLANLTASLKN